jgi:hypothetical protein
VYSTNGPWTTVFNLFRWTFFGAVFLTYLLLRDVLNILKILAMHNGCKSTKENNPMDEDDLRRVEE